MKRRVAFTVEITAADAAQATEIQRHLTWLMGSPGAVDLINTRLIGNDYSQAVHPETGEVIEKEAG